MLNQAIAFSKFFFKLILMLSDKGARRNGYALQMQRDYESL